jgi:hypothetical protein
MNHEQEPVDPVDRRDIVYAIPFRRAFHSCDQLTRTLLYFLYRSVGGRAYYRGETKYSHSMDKECNDRHFVNQSFACQIS